MTVHVGERREGGFSGAPATSGLAGKGGPFGAEGLGELGAERIFVLELFELVLTVRMVVFEGEITRTGV